VIGFEELLGYWKERGDIWPPRIGSRRLRLYILIGDTNVPLDTTSTVDYPRLAFCCLVHIAIIQFRYRRDRQINLGEHMVRLGLPLKPLLHVLDWCSCSGHRSIHDSDLV
jgi:hypothetical protein